MRTHTHTHVVRWHPNQVCWCAMLLDKCSPQPQTCNVMAFLDFLDSRKILCDREKTHSAHGNGCAEAGRQLRHRNFSRSVHMWVDTVLKVICRALYSTHGASPECFTSTVTRTHAKIQTQTTIHTHMQRYTNNNPTHTCKDTQTTIPHTHAKIHKQQSHTHAKIHKQQSHTHMQRYIHKQQSTHTCKDKQQSHTHMQRYTNNNPTHTLAKIHKQQSHTHMQRYTNNNPTHTCKDTHTNNNPTHTCKDAHTTHCVWVCQFYDVFVNQCSAVKSQLLLYNASAF